MRRIWPCVAVCILSACSAAHAPADAGPPPFDAGRDSGLPPTDAGHDATVVIACHCSEVYCSLDPARGDPCYDCCGSPSGDGYCCDGIPCSTFGCSCFEQPACPWPLLCCGFQPRGYEGPSCVNVDTYYALGCGTLPH